MSEPLNINDLINGKEDLETIAEVAMVGTSSDTTINRQGVQVDTIEGRLKKIGFEPPIAYAAGITFTGPADAVKTIDNGGIVYGCLASARPFTTTGNFSADVASFYVIQDGNQVAGNVRTDQSNSYELGTNQSFDAASANTFNLDGQDLGDKLANIDQVAADNTASQDYQERVQIVTSTDDRVYFEPDILPSGCQGFRYKGFANVTTSNENITVILTASFSEPGGEITLRSASAVYELDIGSSGEKETKVTSTVRDDPRTSDIFFTLVSNNSGGANYVRINFDITLKAPGLIPRIGIIYGSLSPATRSFQGSCTITPQKFIT